MLLWAQYLIIYLMLAVCLVGTIRRLRQCATMIEIERNPLRWVTNLARFDAVRRSDKRLWRHACVLHMGALLLVATDVALVVNALIPRLGLDGASTSTWLVPAAQYLCTAGGVLAGAGALGLLHLKIKTRAEALFDGVSLLFLIVVLLTMGAGLVLQPGFLAFALLVDALLALHPTDVATSAMLSTVTGAAFFAYFVHTRTAGFYLETVLRRRR